MFDSKIGVGYYKKGPSPQNFCYQCPTHASATFGRLIQLHRYGPYNNVRDHFVQSFVGTPLFYVKNDGQICHKDKISSTVSDTIMNDETCKVIHTHQSEDGENNLSVPHVNKEI